MNRGLCRIPGKIERDKTFCGAPSENIEKGDRQFGIASQMLNANMQPKGCMYENIEYRSDRKARGVEGFCGAGLAGDYGLSGVWALVSGEA
jgi:hypothetical protein